MRTICLEEQKIDKWRENLRSGEHKIDVDKIEKLKVEIDD